MIKMATPDIFQQGLFQYLAWLLHYTGDIEVMIALLLY